MKLIGLEDVFIRGDRFVSSVSIFHIKVMRATLKDVGKNVRSVNDVLVKINEKMNIMNYKVTHPSFG